MIGYGFPTVGPNPAIAGHFIILDMSAAYFIRIIKCIRHAYAMLRNLRNTFNLRRLFNAKNLHYGSVDVHHVMVLAANGSFIFDFSWI